MVNGEQRIEERIIMEKELRIIISGGGTGGHIFPAVSIANAITEPVSYTHLTLPTKLEV